MLKTLFTEQDQRLNAIKTNSFFSLVKITLQRGNQRNLTIMETMVYILINYQLNPLK